MVGLVNMCMDALHKGNDDDDNNNNNNNRMNHIALSIRGTHQFEYNMLQFFTKRKGHFI